MILPFAAGFMRPQNQLAMQFIWPKLAFNKLVCGVPLHPRHCWCQSLCRHGPGEFSPRLWGINPENIQEIHSAAFWKDHAFNDEMTSQKSNTWTLQPPRSAPRNSRRHHMTVHHSLCQEEVAFEQLLLQRGRLTTNKAGWKITYSI